MSTYTRNGRAAPDLERPINGWVRDEAACVSALMQGGDDERLTVEMFAVEHYRPVVHAIFAMRSEGVEINPEMLCRWLELSGKSDFVGGRDVVYQLWREPCHPEAMAIHADRIVDRYQRRQLKDRARSLYNAADDTSRSVDELLADFQSKQTFERKPRIGMLSSAELARANFKTTWMIDWFLVAGQPCIIAGPKKSLKTNSLVDLTVSLATGGWFLNHDKFKVNRPFRVGLLSGESGGGTIQETAYRVCRSKAVELQDVTNAKWSMELPTFGDPSAERDIIRLIEQNELETIVFDPAYLMLDLGDDASNLFKVGAKLASVTRIQQATGVTPMICHHFKGGQNYDPPELDSIAWAGFREWTRQWLLINRREAYDPERPGDHRLWLAAGGSAGHAGLWGVDVSEGMPSDPGGRRWDVEVRNFSEIRQSSAEARDDNRRQQKRQAVEETQERIRAYLRLNPAGDTFSKIRDGSGNRAAFTTALNELIDTGEVVACKVQKNTRSEDGFRLD